MVVSRGSTPGVAGIATDRCEFEAFYREHLPFVRLYLARRLQDPYLVADLTAEVFLQVLRAATSYRRELGPPRAWLTGIGRHLLADHRHSRPAEPPLGSTSWGPRR